MTNGVHPEGLEPGSLPVLAPSTAPQLGELALRPKASWWDRSKFLIAAVALWWILLWAQLNDNPIASFADGARHELHALIWLEVLFALELIRQLNYFISEHSTGWYRVVGKGVGQIVSRTGSKMDDWTRFRVARVVRIVVLLAILAIILGAWYHSSPLVALFQVPAALFVALPYIAQILFAVVFVVIQFAAIFYFMSKGGMDVYYPGDIRTRFTDIWGQDGVLEKVRENIIFLRDPESIEKRGGYVPSGILLWGPPGTGKTLIAEAVAGETHNPFVFVEPNAFNNMFMGVGQLKVKALFRKLRRLSIRYGGVVVFFDEADALGNRGALTPGGIFGRFSREAAGPLSACNGMSYVRPQAAWDHFRSHLDLTSPEPEPRKGVSKMMGMGGMMGGGSGVLQSLLTELSGLAKPRGFLNRVVKRALGMRPSPPPKYRILVMMATNMPNSLDEALLRPGRIDRIYKVGYPSQAGRIRTYQGYFDKVAHTLSDEDIVKLSTITPYATGATIKDLVNESLINSIREGRETITWSDVVKAKQLKALGPPEDVDYVERERHAVAIHEACHAVVAARVRKELTIDIATIEKGGSYLGMVSSVRVEDTFMSWKSDYEADIMVSLASLAGEKIFFEGDNTSGVSGDLQSATYWATAMEGHWGMGQTITAHSVSQESGIQGGSVRRRGNDERGGPDNRHLGDRIETKLVDLLARTAKLIEANRLEILALAHSLEANKTITGDDALAIVNGTEGPFIDGRRYHTPAFLEAAEAYHAIAVEAHKTHGKIELPLPPLPEVEPVMVSAVGSNGVTAVTTGDPEHFE